MICTSCGTQMDESASACPNCGRPTGVIPADKPVIKDYLTVSIVLLAISCLCMGSFASLATGILGVVFASQARSLIQEEKYAQAQQKAKVAKYLAIATGVLVGMMLLYYILFFALYGMMMASFTAAFAQLPEIFGELDGLYSLLP